MALIGSKPGSVGVWTVSEADLPAFVDVEGLAASEVIITSPAFSQQPAVQYTQSLRDKVYVYVFGERLGALDVTGIVPLRACGSGQSSGLDNIFSYYRSHSVSASGTPTSISVGNTAFRGFLNGVRSTFADPERALLGFVLSFVTLPV